MPLQRGPVQTHQEFAACARRNSLAAARRKSAHQRSISAVVHVGCGKIDHGNGCGAQTNRPCAAAADILSQTPIYFVIAASASWRRSQISAKGRHLTPTAMIRNCLQPCSTPFDELADGSSGTIVNTRIRRYGRTAAFLCCACVIDFV